MRKGDAVIVSPNIKTPNFGWGSVNRNEVGIYLGRDDSPEADPGEVVVAFPSHECWHCMSYELTLVSGIVRIEGKPGMPGPPGITGMQGIPGDSSNMKTRAGTEWRFQSLATLDIDYDEISSELCKANPLALLEAIGKDKESYGVVIHNSLINKAKVCKLDLPKGQIIQMNNCAVVKTTKEEFSDWITWAKVVKAATWPAKYHRKATVKITLAKV